MVLVAPGRGGSFGSSCCLHWCVGGDSLVTAGPWLKSWLSTRPPLTHPSMEVKGHLSAAWSRGNLASPLGLCCEWRVVLFGESKSSRLKVFFLARLPLSWSSGERAGFFGGLFCPYSWVFPGYCILQLQLWNTWGKKKIRDSQLWVVSQVLRSLIALPYSFHLSLLCYFLCYFLGRVLFVFSGKNRENYIYSIFLAVKVRISFWTC